MLVLSLEKKSFLLFSYKGHIYKLDYIHGNLIKIVKASMEERVKSIENQCLVWQREFLQCQRIFELLKGCCHGVDRLFLFCVALERTGISGQKFGGGKMFSVERKLPSNQ